MGYTRIKGLLQQLHTTFARQGLNQFRTCFNTLFTFFEHFETQSQLLLRSHLLGIEKKMKQIPSPLKRVFLNLQSNQSQLLISTSHKLNYSFFNRAIREVFDINYSRIVLGVSHTLLLASCRDVRDWNNPVITPRGVNILTMTQPSSNQSANLYIISFGNYSYCR